jgi:hypothetical protein
VGNGRCISNSGNLDSQATCPTTAITDWIFTEGPVPAAGGSISNLQAETGTAVGSGKVVTVNVIDETPAGVQTVAMTCTVAVGSTTCNNTGTAAVAAGHYLMVRIDTTDSARTWRVTFRY